MSVGADAYIGPRSVHRFNGTLRRIRWFPTGRCGHRPLQGAVHERNWPSIPKMSRTKIRCQLSATVCGTLAGTESDRKSLCLAPEQGAEKDLRVSAINRSPAPLFAYFFWRNRKSRPSETQLQCHCKRGSPVNTDKRADSVVGLFPAGEPLIIRGQSPEISSPESSAVRGRPRPACRSRRRRRQAPAGRRFQTER